MVYQPVSVSFSEEQELVQAFRKFAKSSRSGDVNQLLAHDQRLQLLASTRNLLIDTAKRYNAKLAIAIKKQAQLVREAQAYSAYNALHYRPKPGTPKTKLLEYLKACGISYRSDKRANGVRIKLIGLNKKLTAAQLLHIKSFLGGQVIINPPVKRNVSSSEHWNGYRFTFLDNAK